MAVMINMTDVRYGKLLGIEKVKSLGKGAVWRFKCDCGNITEKLGSTVRFGAIKSCGCERYIGLAKINNFKHGEGHSNKTPEYRAWSGMKERCGNVNNQSYADYGGRGITVCQRWKNDYIAFLTDMGRRPEGHTLERLDVNKGYSPKNCRWATRKTQQRNRRNTLYVEINGAQLPATEISEFLGIRRGQLYSYLKVKRLLKEKYGLD